jgi:two-component system cell cycle sensor histidine kinase/response regulator CckA
MIKISNSGITHSRGSALITVAFCLAVLLLLFVYDFAPLWVEFLTVSVVFFFSGLFLAKMPRLHVFDEIQAPTFDGIIARKTVDQSEFDDIPIALLRLSEEGVVTKHNKAAQDLLGIRKHETPFFNELVEGMGRSVSQWIKKTNQRTGWQKSEFGMARRSKSDVYLRIQLGVVGGHKSTQTTAVVSDATELKSMEAQFVQSQKMQAIGQLAGGIAHDFNNLLTAISGYCDLLMLRHEKGDADFGDLMQISSNANRAAALVGQLLAFSRKQTLKPSAIQINETLSDLTHLLNRLVGETITLNLLQEKDLPLAFVDGRQLEQVIMNLVVNARDAMPNGGQIFLRSKTMEYVEDVTMSGAVILAGKYVSIVVEDEGSGISPNLLWKIFEPFFSTKEVGKGTGLGLSMAYGIIKQTGGYIFADSKVDEGTSFNVLLPVAENLQIVSAPEPEVAKPRPNSLIGARVLLVEDEDPVRAVSQRALQSQGVILESAGGGEEALDILEQTETDFDVIVTDVVMPDIDGPTWVRQAQENGTTAKVIFVSGYAEESFSDEMETFKGAVFLPKPYSLQQLISTVANMADHGKD